MCVFCSIVNGVIPSKKVYEDDTVLAILDIAQTTKGHTLVMTKKHYKDVIECPEDEFKYLMGKVKELAPVIVDKMGANGFNLLINTNEVAGQSVHHLHCHIIPRYDENDTIKVEFQENKYDLDKILDQIKN